MSRKKLSWCLEIGIGTLDFCVDVGAFSRGVDAGAFAVVEVAFGGWKTIFLLSLPFTTATPFRFFEQRRTT